jgi:hypothetical protein
LTRFAWVLNLDAELELARGRPGYVPQRKLTQQLAEHGKSSLQLLGPGDALIEGVAREDAAQFVGRCWCPTPMALAKLHAAGVEAEPHPDPSVLRTVNHRLFAHELGGGLPEQAYVRSRDELELRLGDYGQRWLLKRALSFAGRGQLRVIGPLTDKQESWVEVSLARDGLLLEPLVEPLLEVSLHGFVWRDGSFRLGRTCVQDVSERGTFRGLRLAHAGELTDAELEAFVERAQLVARSLHGAGYFGPFGIDGYRYRRSELEQFCALGEINARYTLGFATGFPDPPSALRLT